MNSYRYTICTFHPRQDQDRHNSSRIESFSTIREAKEALREHLESYVDSMQWSKTFDKFVTFRGDLFGIVYDNKLCEFRNTERLGLTYDGNVHGRAWNEQ